MHGGATVFNNSSGYHPGLQVFKVIIILINYFSSLFCDISDKIWYSIIIQTH